MKLTLDSSSIPTASSDQEITVDERSVDDLSTDYLKWRDNLDDKFNSDEDKKYELEEFIEDSPYALEAYDEDKKDHPADYGKKSH